MQRLHCQPAGVSANRWGNAGAGTPKLGLPWKRFASWSPAISLQLFSFQVLGLPELSLMALVSLTVTIKRELTKYELTVLLRFFPQHYYDYYLTNLWFVLWNAYEELCSGSPRSYFSLMSLDVMSWPRLSACTIVCTKLIIIIPAEFVYCSGPKC